MHYWFMYCINAKKYLSICRKSVLYQYFAPKCHFRKSLRFPANLELSYVACSTVRPAKINGYDIVWYHLVASSFRQSFRLRAAK